MATLEERLFGGLGTKTAAPAPEPPAPRSLEDALFGGAVAAPPTASPAGTLIGAATEGMPPLPEPWTRPLAAAARVIPPIAVGASGYGLPLMGVAGGAGAGLAQLIERAGGAREQFAPLEIPLQAALSAFPVGKLAGAGPVARTLARAGQGAALAGAGSAGTELAEGRAPTVGRTLEDALFGGLLGGAGGALEARLGRAPAPLAAGPTMTAPTPSAPPPRAPVSTPPGITPITLRDLPTMTAADLEAAAGQARTFEQNIEAHVFGPEAGAKYRRLQRVANGQSDNADQAYREVQAMEDALSEDQRNLLFGVGQPGYNAEELRTIAGAARTYDPANVTDMPEAALLNTVGRELTQGAPHQDPVSAVRLAGAMRELGRRGKDEQVVLSAVAGRAAQQGVSPEDARELLADRLAKLQSMREAPSAPQIEAPPIGSPGTPTGLGDIAGPGAADEMGSAFTRLPGVGGEIPPAQPRPDAKLQRQIERVDELHGTLPKPNRELLQGVIADNADDLEKAARGEQPIPRTIGLADELVIDPERLRREMRDRGGAAPEVQMAALDQHVGFFTKKTYDAAAAAAANPNDPTLKLAAKKAYTDLVSYVAGATSHAADAGRVLRIRREMAKAYSPVGGVDPRVIKKALTTGIDADRLVDMLSKMDPDDTLGQFRMLQSLRDPGTRGYWRWYWYSSLLSRPRTHMRNVIGNTVNLAYKVASTPVAGALERASGVAPENRTVLAGELGHQLHAWRTALPEAWSKALYLFKNGFTLDDVGSLEMRPPEVFGGKLLPNVIGRALGAADAFARHVAAEVERHGTAYADAWKASQGLEGPARAAKLADVMADRLANPTPAMLQSMKRFSSRATFQEDLPPWMDDFMRGRERMPPALGMAADFVMPFVRTPFNILRQGVQASPAGFATGLGREAGRQGSQARGAAALATMLLAPVAWMAANGNLTGSGPKDPAAADALYKQGWRPNSFRISRPDGRDVYIPYGQMQPIALPFSVVANAFEAAKAGETIDPLMIGAKTAKSVLQSSFLSGTLAALEALDDPEAKLQKFASQTTQSLVPLSGAMSTVRELQDYGSGNDYLREPKSIGEAVGVGIPTQMRDALGLPDAPARVRATGEPARTSRGLAGILLGVDAGKAPVQSPLDAELERLGDTGLLEPLTLPSRKLSVGGKKQVLSRTDEYTLRQARGVAVREALEDMMATPAYQKAPDEKRAERVRYYVTRTRDYITRRAATVYHRTGRITLEDILPPRLQP